MSHSGTGKTPTKPVDPSPAKVFTSFSDDGKDEMTDKIVSQALAEISDLQFELEKLNDKASEEVLKVESTYNKLRKPCYEQRNEAADKIPKFWTTVLLNYPQIALMLNEEEVDCLHFLRNLVVEECENVEDGFRIKFTFDKNPFFEPLVLTKEFQFKPRKMESKSISTTINWKDGRDFFQINKVGEKVTEGLKRKLEVGMTFFSWFMNNENPNNDQVADMIKDDLWMNPLPYYLYSDPDIDEIQSNEEEEDINIVENFSYEDSSNYDQIEPEEEDDNSA